MKQFFKYSLLFIATLLLLQSCSSPNPIGALSNAETAAAQGNWEDAEEILKDVLSSSSKYPEILVLYSLCMSQKKDHKSALNYLKKSYKLLPEKTILLWFIATEYYKLNDLKKSRAYFISYYEKNPNDFDALTMIVNCEGKLALFKNSPYLPKLAQYLQTNNLKGEAYNLKGVQNATSGNLRKSFIYFKRAEAKSKNTPAVLLNLAILYDKRNAKTHAIRYYAKYLEAIDSASPANTISVRKRIQKLQESSE